MKKGKAAAWLLTGAMAVTMCAPAAVAVQAEGVEGIDNDSLLSSILIHRHQMVLLAETERKPQ